MKSYLFKDGSIITASTIEEARAKHSVIVAMPFKRKKALTPEQRKIIEDAKSKIEGFLKSKVLEDVINADVYKDGSVSVGLKDGFYIKLGENRHTIDEQTIDFNSAEDALSSLTKNKDKWIELDKCAKRLEELCGDLGLN